MKPGGLPRIRQCREGAGVFWAVINEPPLGSVGKKAELHRMGPLRILHLEATAGRRDHQGVLEGDGLTCLITRVETRDGFIAALEEAAFD